MVSAPQSVKPSRLDLPVHWPSVLTPDRLVDLAHTQETPFLVCDLGTVTDRLEQLRAALPEADIHYALKCNPSPEIVRTLLATGTSFEVASFGELDLLLQCGVRGEDVLYSNTVKPGRHICRAVEAGVWRFAFDSETELHKLAELAPGAPCTCGCGLTTAPPGSRSAASSGPSPVGPGR